MHPCMCFWLSQTSTDRYFLSKAQPLATFLTCIRWEVKNQQNEITAAMGYRTRNFQVTRLNYALSYQAYVNRGLKTYQPVQSSLEDMGRNVFAILVLKFYYKLTHWTIYTFPTPSLYKILGYTQPLPWNPEFHVKNGFGKYCVDFRIYWAMFESSSVSAFIFDQCKILSFGKNWKGCPCAKNPSPEANNID